MTAAATLTAESPGGRAEPPTGPEPEAVSVSAPVASAAPVEAVGDSLTVAVWTAISRVTGVARGVVVAAVLGATVFANTYQFTNSLPNLVFYGFLGGSLLSSLLIPALVRHVDRGDRGAAGRVAGGFLGVVAVGAAVVTPIAVLLAVVGLRVASFGGPGGGQARVAVLLVLMLLPQVPLYGLVATAGAVMNSQGRFALAAAAPALENVGTVVVLGAVWLLYPGLGDLQRAPLGALLLLGWGTTASVALHATVQWWGARRVGVVLRPRRGWRDAEVRHVLRRTVPSLAQAGLAAVQLLVLLVIANRVAGGVVAFQLAMNFYFLPIALGATPVALSLAPRLARLAAPADGPRFRDTFVQGLTFALFVAVPAAAGYAAVAGPLGRAISYGGFGSGGGASLVTASVAALAVGVLGETAFLVATYACYARTDTRSPMRAMLVQLVVSVAVAGGALFARGATVLVVLGAAQSAGTVIGAGYLVFRLLRDLPAGTQPLARPVLRMITMALAMAVPAYAVGGWVADRVGAVAGVLAAAVLGAGVYLGCQAVLRAPELAWITGAVRQKLHRTDLPSTGAEPDRPAARPSASRPAGPRGSARQPGFRPGVAVSVALVLACVAVGALAGVSPLLAVGLVAVLGLIGWVCVRPAVAAYVLIFATPLTAGIDRGTVVPVLRPNEAIAVLVGLALVIRWLLMVRTGEVRLPRWNSLDRSLVGLAVCSSVVPLLMMLVRHREISADDLQYAIVLWKYLAVYVIVRLSISTSRQALWCLVASMLSASIVCVIGILQSLDLFGVPGLLATYYAPFGVERTLAIGRGSSTLSLAAAVADLAILNLAIAIGLLLRGSKHRLLLGAVVLCCVFGALGAGEFSTVIGLLVGMTALIIVSRATRLFGYAVPLLLIGGLVMWPVIQTRLSGFQSASGLPDSWIVRLRNLNTYFWPQLTSHANWLFGVRPSARVPASHEEFGWVWIESGYTWLLWGGGIPLLAAYGYFVVVSLRRAVAVARRSDGVVTTVALAIVAVVTANVVLMLFDPHLTYRGAADALFGLLALLQVLDRGAGGGDPPGAPASDHLPERVSS